MPFAVAESVAVWAVVTDATVAVNEALVAPEATVTLPGAVRALLLLATETLTPVDGAAPLSDTVHADVPAPVNEVVAHDKPLSDSEDDGLDVVTGPLSLIDVICDDDPCVAVRVTVCDDCTAATFA